MSIINDLKSIYFRGNEAIVTDCEAMGIIGYCGLNCPIFLQGGCKNFIPNEIILEIKALPDSKRYIEESEIEELYPDVKEFRELEDE
jgi:hypothetical protein